MRAVNEEIKMEQSASKQIKFRWEDVAPDMIAVQDNEGNVGLLTRDEWEEALDRAQTVMVMQIAKFHGDVRDEEEIR